MNASTITESDFSRGAETILDAFLAEIERDKDHQPRIGGVSIFEPNTAPLALYYIRKGLLLEALGRPQNGGSSPLRNGLLKAAWLLRETLLTAKTMGHWKESLQPAEILFICNVPRQFESIAPVLRELSGNAIQCAVVSQTPLPIVAAKRYPGVAYYDSLSLRNIAYLRDLSLMIPAWKSYCKRRLHTRINERGIDWIEHWFRQKGHRAIRTLLFASRVIEEVIPKVIAVTDPADAEAKGFSLAGKAKGIPSFCVQYGMAGPYDSEWHYFAQDFIGSLDEESSRIIQGHGIPEKRILLSGSPRFDSYRDDPSLRVKIRKRLNVPEGFPLIVFLSIPPAPRSTGKMESYISIEEHDDLLVSIYGLAENAIKDRCIVAVKPHPEEDASAHREFLDRFDPKGIGIRMVQGMTSYEAINAADLVITSHSTTGLEAIYLDKPLITVNFTGRPDYDDYASSGAAWPIRRRDDLGNAVRELLRNPEAGKPLREGRLLYKARNPYFESASSTKRCAEIIMSLQKGRTPEPQ